ILLLYCSTIVFIPLLCLASLNPLKILPFFASTGFEAKLTFDHSVEFQFNDLDPEKDADAKTLREEIANSAIKKQLKFLAGALSVQQEDAMQASLKGYTAKITDYNKKDRFSWIANYHFEGTVLFKDRTTDEIQLSLPIDPEQIWAASGKTKIIKNPQTGQDECFNPCMEVCVPGDYIEFYFYYFWKPALPGCPLKEASQVKDGEKADYRKFQASFTRLETLEEKNKKVSHPKYPRYNELVRIIKEGNKVKQGELNVSLFVGMDDQYNSWRPIAENSTKQDDGGKSYALYQKELESLGFKAQKWSISQVINFYESNGFEWRRDDFVSIEETKEGQIVTERVEKLLLPTVIDYKRIFNYKKSFGGKVEMRIRLVFTPTGLHEKSKFFQLFFKNALKHDSIVICDVHSGMGKDLDLALISHALELPIKISKNQYQILHVDACSTYGY
ncbi:MAG: hypothetical protein HY072_00520, partial [Deltaproteobacteria bacterium]|nr:hypothetical protein [Deltaproteobacteria bacterium]